MKSLLSTLILTTIVTFSTFSQRNFIKLSSTITTEARDVSSFDKVRISEDFIVHIRHSDTNEKVEIEANENLHDLIQVRTKGGTLIIDTKPYSYNYNNRKKDSAPERLVAYITVKSLTEISANEDVVIKLEDPIETENLTIRLDEDCTLRGAIHVSNLTVDLNEDSVLQITGSATAMKANAVEDSVINGPELTVGTLSIKLNEDSEANLTVNGDIDLVAREDSYFYYNGTGQFTSKRLRRDSEAGKL